MSSSSKNALRASQILSELLPSVVELDGGERAAAANNAGCVGAGGDSWCKPQLRKAYYKRLRTYSATSWFDKPSSLSAPECAKYGWVNDGVDELVCESCRSRLKVSLHSSLNEQSMASAAAAFSSKVNRMLRSSLGPLGLSRAILSLHCMRFRHALSACNVLHDSLHG